MIIALDILFQFLFGFNLSGNEPVSFPGTTYYSGFFNKELIAGGFILMFSIIGFLQPLLLKKKKFILFLFFLGVFSILVIALCLQKQDAHNYVYFFCSSTSFSY